MLTSRFLSRNESSQGPPPQQYEQQQGPSASSSFFASILTSTTSKYNNLRRQLISSEADGDTEDDSHISRVLRAYYTEKEQRLPEWLPPDPKTPVAAAPVQFVSSNRPPQGQQTQQQQTAGARWGRGGLSDLWDSGNKNAQPQEAESLRQARPGMRNTNSDPNAPQSGGGRFAQQHPQQPRQNLTPETQARPLPSQRAGSYQSQQGSFQSRFGGGEPSPPASAGSGGTAQERLKQRLWGAGRSNSPTNSVASSTSSNTQQGGSRNPYAEQSSSGSRNPYAVDGGGRDRFGGSGNQDRQQGGGPGRPVVSANSPWAGSGDDYGDGGRYDRHSPQGLANGPRPGRQGHGQGLPSGPRPTRY